MWFKKARISAEPALLDEMLKTAFEIDWKRSKPQDRALKEDKQRRKVIGIHVPIVPGRNVVLQAIRHFSISGASKIARLRGSVVLKCSLESVVRTSSWKSETRFQIAVDNCQKVLELLRWYEEKWLLVRIERRAVQVEATAKTTSVSTLITLCVLV